MGYVFAKPMANKCTMTNTLSIVEKNKEISEHHCSQELATQYDCIHQSLTWLKYDVDDQDKTLVKVLQCSACTNVTATGCL